MLPQLFVNGLIAGGVYSLVALGFTLIYSTARFFHFAHGAVYAWGAYLVYALGVLAEMPLALAIPLALAALAALGAAMEAAIYRPLRARGASALVLLLVSLGLFVILQSTIP